MVGFLQGLGSFAEGFAPGLDKLYQQQSEGDFGNALASIYGGQQGQQGQQQGGLGSIGSAISGMFGGGQQQVPQAQITPVQSPVQTPMPGGPQQGMPQGGMQAPQIQQTPLPQPQQMTQPQQQLPRVQQPAVSPAVAQGGGGLPQPQQAPQFTQPPPQQQQQQSAPPPQQQQEQTPQERPQQQQQGGLGPAAQLDLPTLVKSLVAHGVTGHRLGAAVKQFTPLLNAQGLQQYHQLGLQLQQEKFRDLQEDRRFNRDPTALGSRAQNRAANQDIALERMDAVQQRFEKRMAAAAEKFKSARSDKEVLEARKNMDKVQGDLRGELQSELSIVNTPGTSPEEQKAALQKAAEIRQQMEQASEEAVKARRSGGASGDQVGGMSGAEKAPAGDSGKPDTAYMGDKQMKWNHKEPYSDPKNWAPADGG